jgi:steroid 5-alpha reductase family enzyme
MHDRGIMEMHMHPLFALTTIGLLMTFVWVWYLWTNNPGVVDVAWAIGLMLLGLMQLHPSNLSIRTLLFSAVLVIWGLRLAGFLWWTRIRIKQHDKRYTNLDISWFHSKNFAFFCHYQLQGLFILMIATPWYFIGQGNEFTGLEIIGLCGALLAVCLETLADWQLLQFKKTHRKQVCNIGLWHYSRHPNYFFEWLTWCAFTVCALSTPYGWLAWISPLTLYLIMTKITAPMTEAGSIKARGKAYLAYQQQTPMFFLRLGKIH